MMSHDVLWPGVPDDSKPFKNVYYQDDLLTYAEYQAALESEIDGLQEMSEEDNTLEEIYD